MLCRILNRIRKIEFFVMTYTQTPPVKLLAEAFLSCMSNPILYSLQIDNFPSSQNTYGVMRFLDYSVQLMYPNLLIFLTVPIYWIHNKISREFILHECVCREIKFVVTIGDSLNRFAVVATEVRFRFLCTIFHYRFCLSWTIN